MQIAPIASTRLSQLELLLTPYRVHAGAGVTDADELTEVAGRTRDQSWDRPDAETNEDYLAQALDERGLALFEHVSVTFYIEDVTLALVATLAQIPGIAVTAVSHPTADLSRLRPIVPALIDELEGIDWPTADAIIAEHHHYSMESYERLEKIFVEQGFPPEHAREAARAVLPTCIDSPALVTGSLRAWRVIVTDLGQPIASLEEQEFASLALGALREIAPHGVRDLDEGRA